MEKRTIIAFVLSFLILIMWSFLFAPKKEEPQKKEALAPEYAAKPSPQSQPLVAPQEQQLPPAAPVHEPVLKKEREILVETPLYKAVFSTAGASIKSYKLKNYRETADPQSPLVELANTQDRKSLLEISFQAPATENPDHIFYQPSEEALVLDSSNSPQDLTFRAVTPEGLSIQKTYRFDPDKYPIHELVSVSNQTGKSIQGNLRATIANLPPQKKKSYYSFVGLAFLLNDELEQVKPKDMKKEEKRFAGQIGWIAYEEDYFLTAVVPEDSQSEASFLGRALPSGILTATYLAPSVALPEQGQLNSRFTLYLGPRDLTILKQADKKLDLAIDFGWTDIIAKPLLYALRFFNQYVHNYGVSIIILTVLIKILFWPLTHKSYKSMKEMQKLQPLMTKIREKYKNNKEQMNKELMNLYKTYKINPMGGCLPMIIQIPVFFALFRILGSSIELRHAPFLFWINDLSAPDRLFSFPFKIPFMSPPYGIPVLTLLMGLSMLIQQKMTPTPGDPTQAKMMMFLPIIFTVMFINFPSGLVLYWLVNNVLSIGQQYRIIKKSA
ncbi:MAG: membrane protein insertase YidC [Deltaproteobacteria bacterium]|jgi:YidC/Oxa1 family membrane protein insertase